jgi:uncharacterized protein (TIGR03437 family)
VGHAGVPNEAGTCNTAGCHVGTAVNGGGGSVAVTFPNGNTYVPGVKQQLTVTITDSKQKAWGFQLTARNASSSSTVAGTFASADANTLVMCGTTSLDINTEQVLNFPGAQNCPANLPMAYIEHSLTGYNATLNKVAGSGAYNITWTPPSTNVGNIVIYVAGNAANGDLTVNGDHIYTATYTLTPTTAGPNPTISEVDNGFSNVPNSPIEAANWVVIKGTNLSNTNRGWNSTEQNAATFPTSMDGVSVTVNGKPAFLYFISSGQLNLQAPSDAASGPVNVVVNNNGSLSSSATTQLQPYSPALLQWGGGQFPYAEITRYPDNAYVGNPAVITGTVSAKAGDILTLWVTGLGATNPAIAAGQQPSCANGICPSVANNPTVTVGGSPVTVLGAILRYAGLYQVNVQLPASLSSGDTPIKLLDGSYQSPDGVLLHIQ